MKKLLVPAAGILGLAVFAFLIMRFLPKKHLVPTPLSGKPSLAVLYFENISGDKSLDPWKTALTELLITKLSQSKYINVLSSDRIFSLLKRLNLQEARKYSTEDLVRVADEAGATYTLSGSLMKAGKNIIMTLTLQKPRTGEVISPLNIECGGEEEIFPKVDELAKTIKSDMNLTPDQIATDIDKEIGKITTPSPEAYKFYSEAIKCGNKGDPKKAVELCHKAVAIDPEFAVAYVLMGVSYYNLGLRVKEREFLQKAFDLKDRVSDRERYMIEGEYYGLSEKTYDESIEAFKKLLELYPEDYLGRNDLGWTYYQVEEWDQAIEQLSMIVQGSKTIPTDTYVLLASAYNAKGLYDKTIKLLEDSRTRIGENWLMRLLMGYTYLCQGQYDFALTEADKSLALETSHANGHALKAAVYGRRGDLTEAQKEALEYRDKASGPDKVDAHWALAGIAISQGKYREAKDDLARAIDLANNIGEKGIQSEQHLALAYTSLKSGDREKARREAESALVSASEAESLKWQRYSLFLQGLISIEAGSLDKAQKTAAELKDLIDKGMNKKAIRYYDNLLGRLELKRENYSKAIELFNRALAQVPFPYSPRNDYALFIEPLAVAYYSSGNVGKSVEEYERLASYAAGGFFYGDIRARSFYMLGKIAEHQGDKARARENYQKFLDLWKNADPGRPEVEDARKRLAMLKAT